ncbi:hypothetical protein [Spirosoma fluviale]|uniref:Uncharacterized protein n=1 Tax=Spirosoma fluviale TaxID=1597977 RepID=A0A286GTD0_9BACT|nr:hypothetical protein [Spirosoma fluviale]SOD98788.1 hypothetical protein SAMN06269250_6227 [Spirosoma fluviale]
MKTSHILLAILTIITLSGMVATDVLLKQQYDKLDWSDPYQDFEHRALSVAKHLVIEAAPIAEVIVEPSKDTAQAILWPNMANSYRTRKQGDTLFVTFTMNYEGESRNPHDDKEYQLPAGLVLRLPDLQSLRITNGRLTIRQFTPETLVVLLKNSRLRTDKLGTTSGSFQLTASQNSFAVLGADHYKSLAAIVQDSSGVQLNDSEIGSFTKQVSTKAEIQLQGKALKWLK